MKLSDHDLLQLTEEDLLELPEEILRHLSVKLLTDLKEARERLKQTSRNSSRPPSSDKPWDSVSPDEQEEGLQQDDKASPANKKSTDDDAIEPVKKEQGKSDAQRGENKRKPGKQPGAAGYGREQKIAVTLKEAHYPRVCARCDRALKIDSAKAYTAFETVDVEWADPEKPGLHLINTQHLYYEIDCDCGHCTRQAPHRQVSHVLTPAITLSEWRLVGPGLAALIVCLAYRMRLSRVRIQEFLLDWLGLQLSVGTLNATLHESGAAVLPVEDELVEALQNSSLLNIDETSWPELQEHLWLWVFCGQGVVAYWIATRGSELLDNVLGNAYQG